MSFQEFSSTGFVGASRTEPIVNPMGLRPGDCMPCSGVWAIIREPGICFLFPADEVVVLLTLLVAVGFWASYYGRRF